MRRVLMIAYHFPPVQGSSGVQRTLRFARDLRDFGWHPVVLTAHPRAYEKVTDDQMDDVPEDVPVIRAQALDAARHLKVAGYYPGAFARPDRWISWWFGAVPAGLAAIGRYRPAALWSTYPIATAHRIAATLERRSGLPWLADFRDPMAQDGYPEDPATWRSFARIEKRTIERAATSTFTTPSALRTYQARYPQAASRMALLENGYDEATFASVDGGSCLNPDHLTLVHSGVVYPSERDPTELFRALRSLRQSEPELFARLKVRFRAAGHDDFLHALASQNDVESAVEILPPVGYRDALSEMLRADGLLILQAANCNAQVPAKLYEYLRARRPVIALTDPQGDTASVARNAGLEAIAPLDDAGAIHDLLSRFVREPSRGTIATEDSIAQASRRARAMQLAQLLDRATA